MQPPGAGQLDGQTAGHGGILWLQDEHPPPSIPSRCTQLSTRHGCLFASSLPVNPVCNEHRWLLLCQSPGKPPLAPRAPQPCGGMCHGSRPAPGPAHESCLQPTGWAAAASTGLIPVPRAPPAADAWQDPAVSPQGTWPCPWSLPRAPGGPRGHNQPQPLPGSALLLVRAVKYQGCFWVCVDAAGNGSSRSTSRLRAGAGRTPRAPREQGAVRHPGAGTLCSRAPGTVSEPHLSAVSGAPPAPDPAASESWSWCCGHSQAPRGTRACGRDPAEPCQHGCFGRCPGARKPQGAVGTPQGALLAQGSSAGPGREPGLRCPCGSASVSESRLRKGPQAWELQHPLGRAGAAPDGRAMPGTVTRDSLSC